jgi:drug/metabolite transporter (DMT)-like permease
MTATILRIIVAFVFMVAGIAIAVMPSPSGPMGTAIGVVCAIILAVAFVLDMRESRAERREYLKMRTGIQVISAPSSGQDGDTR